MRSRVTTKGALLVLMLGLAGASWPAGRAEACKCATTAPFLASAMSGSVLVVEVVRGDPKRYLVEVDVREHWSGPVVTGRFELLGGDGGNCNAGVDHFKPGQKLVVAVQEPKAARKGVSGLLQASLYACGAHHVLVDGADAVGAIDDGVKRLPLATLKERVRRAQQQYDDATRPR